MSHPLSEGTIYISHIALEVRPKFGKPVYHVVLQTKTGRFTKEIPDELPPGHTHLEVFDPAFELSARDQLSVSLRYQTGYWRIGRSLRITMKQNEIITQAQDDGHGRETHVMFRKNILVTIGFSRTSERAPDGPSPSTLIPNDNLLTSPIPNDVPLPSTTHWSPTTSEVLRICPRFRVLIIGNTGVGKSTLIRNVFGVKGVDVSEASRGRADIDREFVAAENKLFVVHDSLGLEAAEGDNFNKVKDFIDDRQKREKLEDRLHAVWVCLAVPYAKGRLLEAGMEEFLRHRKAILGDIPIVVVLTKLDLLDNALMMALDSEGVEFKSIEEAGPFLDPRRNTFLIEYCTQPLLRAAESSVPHVAVSAKGGYGLEPTISELVKMTTSEIERYLKAGPSYATATELQGIERNAPLYIAGMAQRASVEAKVDLAIAIGKKRYWSSPGACIGFSAGKVEEYLLVLHQDIIQAWNFYDPEEALQGDGLKEALLDTSDLGVDHIPDGLATLGSMPLAPAMSSLLSDLPTVVTLSLTATVALATLCSQIRKSAKTTARRFMAYIVDLIYLMKILFVLAPQGSITSRDVALAFEAYKRSTYRYRVHSELKDFDTGSVVLPGGRDVVVDKIETLVRRYNLTDEDVSRSRRRNQLALSHS